MLDESECKNSGGWFKDPFTGMSIGPDYPRAITCKSGDKWVQPAVCFQNGDIVKISGRCWNDDERACYKEYRGGASSGSPLERKLREPKSVKQKVNDIKEQEEQEEQEKEVVRYDSDSSSSVEVLAILAECDRCLGIARINDIFYSLVTKHDSSTAYLVPRDVIPNAEFNRLCCSDRF